VLKHLVCRRVNISKITLTFALQARRSLVDIEKSQGEALAERQIAEGRLQVAEQRLRELEAKLEEEGRESSDIDMLRQRLAEELEDEREQHQKDIAARDFTTDQTRKKYQGQHHNFWPTFN
jgi:myosin protein heavy chain